MAELNQETVALLETFLREQKEADLVAMIRNTRDWQMQHDADDKVRFEALSGKLGGFDLRLGHVESDVKKLQDNADDTGRHNLAKLEEQLEKKSARHWLPIAVGVVSCVIGALGTYAAFIK